MSLYLGCIHEEGEVIIDGHEVRTMTFNQEPFFLDKVDKYKELCLEKGNKEVKLSAVTTPYKDSAKESCARRPQYVGGSCVSIADMLSPEKRRRMFSPLTEE